MDTAPTTCAEMLGLLDEAISGLRVAAGETSFAHRPGCDGAAARSARSGAAAAERPSAAEAITQAIAAAKATDIAVDRVSILRGVIAALDNPRNALPAAWTRADAPMGAPHDRAKKRGSRKAYGALTSTTLKRATAAAGRADVRAVEACARDGRAPRRAAGPEAARRDQRAASSRCRVQLDAARRLRLARDQWHERAASYRAYKKSRRAHPRMRWCERSAASTTSSALPGRTPRCSSASAIAWRRHCEDAERRWPFPTS